MTSNRPPEPQDPHVSRRRFLARAGVALGTVPLVGLTRVEDALAAPPPTVYDVTTYGAQGDGTTDDSNAIQAAIDAANARGGGTIVFPAGAFRVTRAITIYSRIVFRGAGMGATTIRKSNGGGRYPVIRSPNYDPPGTPPTEINNWSLQNISLDGNKAGGPLGHGLQAYGYGWTLFNVSIANCAGRGIWSEYLANLPDSGEPLEAMLANVRVHGCAEGGIYWNGPHDSQWVNIIIYRCGPPGDTGSKTKGAEVRGHGAGIRVTNSHVWGTNHAYAWFLDCDGANVFNSSGEGAEHAQIALLQNDSAVVGGKIYASRIGNKTRGIQIGEAGSDVAPAGTFIYTKIVNCELGSLVFENDHGFGRYVLSVWQPAGKVVVVQPAARLRTNNRFDLQVSGGASVGDLAGMSPVTFQEDVLSARGLEARGDVRAGSATSKLAFFGAEPEHRTAPWSVGNLPDQRGLDASADLTQVRAALATLLRDLQSYGLLDS
jgi:hypothetical protein